MTFQSLYMYLHSRLTTEFTDLSSNTHPVSYLYKMKYCIVTEVYEQPMSKTRENNVVSIRE